MVLLCLDQRKMLSVVLMKNQMRMNAKDAATEAGSVVGFNEKAVRRRMRVNSHYSSKVSLNDTVSITT